MRSILRLTFLIALMSLTLLPVAVHCEERNTCEVGFGAGRNLHSLDTTHLMVIPAIGWKLTRAVHFRLEGDLEFLFNRSATFIGGVAPFLRFYAPSEGIKPFIELGGGINYTTRRTIEERRVGGPVLFSAMGGVGIQFKIGQTPATLSYRVRHLSNAHIYNSNQGLNSHFIIFTVLFPR